jgi:hypothetical protein
LLQIQLGKPYLEISLPYRNIILQGILNTFLQVPFFCVGCRNLGKGNNTYGNKKKQQRRVAYHPAKITEMRSWAFDF